jgi:hypothetical protein
VKGLAIVSATAMLGLGVQGTAAFAAPLASNGSSGVSTAKQPSHKLDVRPLCSEVKSPGEARCFALRVVSKPKIGIQPHADSPNGYGPADLADAYNLPANGGEGTTVAIVDAYDNPNALADLEVYRAQFGLPPLEEGQFKKINQRGEEGDYPAPDDGWAGEISLDLDMVSAIAPKANIILVEADSPSFDDLGSSVNQAVAQGAKYVSNSYGTGYSSTPGSGEDPSETAYAEEYYNHPGVAVVASSGDSDYGVSFPSTSKYVTSVGGTALVKDSSTRGWSESVWHNSYGGPGSGCSLYVDKPAFQTDTGCDMRASADVSAVADPATGVAVYNTYGTGTGWAQYGGTSASAPIIAATYALAGTPAEGAYPNAFPYAKPGALNDVTEGLNGTCDPDYLCTAGPGYDGPTGLGTPNGLVAFTSGPHGDVKGTVTDSSTGEPLGGATVSAGDATATTDETGAYDLAVEPGTYDVTISAYGYVTKTIPDVVVTQGATVNEDAALKPAKTSTVTGTVSDGSGHGWPMYAKVTVAGTPGAPVYTNPYTGRYSVELPRGATYELKVDSNYPGYISADKSVRVGGADKKANFKLKADPFEGTAPGYTQVSSGPSESFDGTSVPDGWAVDDATDGGGWVFDDPGSRGNLTGGEGNFAIVDSDHLGIGQEQDSTLTAPTVDFTGDDTPMVSFDSYYKGFGGQSGKVEYSVDGGSTWISAWEQTTGTTSGHEQVELPEAANQADVQVRFHFTGSWGYYWEIDNVQIGTLSLKKVSGGLVAGNVTDQNTGDGVNGATVTNSADETESTTTVPTPDNADLPDGFFWMFNQGSGARSYDVTKGGYSDASVAANLQVDYITKADVALAAGQLSVNKTTLKRIVDWKGAKSGNIKLTNTGTAPATVKVGERAGGFTVLAKHGAKLNRVKAHTSMHSMAKAAKKSFGAKSDAIKRHDATPSDSTWESMADLPVAMQDNVAGVNNGVLYSAFGYNGSADTKDLYAYDSEAGTWSQKASAADTRESPAHGWLNGKWYISGGWGSDAAPDAKTEVYDPTADSWGTAAQNPSPLAGSGSATLGGKLYVVGGCATTCGSTVAQVYDPAADAWSPIADYPEPISWESCGGISGAIYCAGGTTDAGAVKTAYKYDVATDSWSPIADLPVDLWGSDYTAANGMLLVSGGVTAQGTAITNEGYAFDPQAGEWTPLPNTNTAVYRGGSALGFYKVGGSPGGQFSPPLATVELLPGFDQGGSSDVTWMSENKDTLTLAPGQTKAVRVTLDSDVPEITQPGTFTASLTFQTDTPYTVAPVAVTLKVRNPATWGKLMGAVSDEDGAAVPGATVELDSWATHYTLKTDKDGNYVLWLDARNNPITMIVAKDGYRPQTTTVNLKEGRTVTRNFVLKKP